MAEEVSQNALSEDQEIEDKVRELKEMFKDRYTERDEDFMKTVSTPLPDPPCVKNWFVRQRGNWNRDGGQRGFGDRRHDNRYGNRDNYHGNRDNYHGNRDSYHGNRDSYHGNRGSYHGNQRQYQDHQSYRGGHQQRHDKYDSHGNQRKDNRYQPY